MYTKKRATACQRLSFPIVMAAEQPQWRDLTLLHVHHDTLTCAFTRCIACCYKIALHSRPGLLPNVRPEMCHRFATKVETKDERSIGLYDAKQVKRILTVGDGNFSYSLALARALCKDADVEFVATSHESNKTVLDTYPDSAEILAELNAMPHVTVQHEVDATNAEQMKELGQFDRVIWNFPCVRAPRGEDGQNQEMDMNKKLLHGFFAHVAQILTATGEVHVTHKTKAPFGQWGIENIAKDNKLRHQQSVVFDRCLYPGYSNKKVLSKGSFPIWDSLTFVFVPEERAQPETPVEGEIETTADEKQSAVPVEPVTMEILKKLYLLLTPSLDDILGSKKKKRKGLNSVKSSTIAPVAAEGTTVAPAATRNSSSDGKTNTQNNHKRPRQAFVHSKAGKQRKKGRR
jgi:25S rRNA (uracil2634-N3)-methyltransferase